MPAPLCLTSFRSRAVLLTSTPAFQAGIRPSQQSKTAKLIEANLQNNLESLVCLSVSRSIDLVPACGAHALASPHDPK
jgi:hypothetical protein